MSLIRRLYGRDIPADVRLWHRWNVFFPVRTVSGHIVNGYVWRKRENDRWVYQQYEETEEEYLTRQ